MQFYKDGRHSTLSTCWLYLLVKRERLHDLWSLDGYGSTHLQPQHHFRCGSSRTREPSSLTTEWSLIYRRCSQCQAPTFSLKISNTTLCQGTGVHSQCIFRNHHYIYLFTYFCVYLYTQVCENLRVQLFPSAMWALGINSGCPLSVVSTFLYLLSYPASPHNQFLQ